MTAIALEQREPNCELELNGELFVCDPHGCLYWPQENCLIVSDLHLEKGSSQAIRGRMIPPFDTGATLDRLQERIAYWHPKRIISLGDSFHDDEASTRLPKPYFEQLSAMMSGREWIWILGNHDPSAPKNLPGHSANEMAIGPVVFRHEPEIAADGGHNPGEIAGHLHPAAKIRRRGRTVRRRCFVGDGSRLIMPSFGAFTGGLNIRDEAFDNLFDQNHLRAWLLGSKWVFEIEGRLLVT